MSPQRFPGFNERLNARMIEVGYVRDKDGKPDSQRLAIDLKTSSANVYRWRKGMVPEEWLPALAKRLRTTQEYLLFGKGDRDVPVIDVGFTDPDGTFRSIMSPPTNDDLLIPNPEVRSMSQQIAEIRRMLGTQQRQIAELGRIILGSRAPRSAKKLLAALMQSQPTPRKKA